MGFDQRLDADRPELEAAAFRLILAIQDSNFDAYDATLAEVGDCPGCLRHVIDQLAIFGQAFVRNAPASHGWDRWIVDNIANRLDDAREKR